MKSKIYSIIILVTLLFISDYMFAGNKDRSGQAGATELLINPWARSSGMHSVNTAGVRGLEAMRLNVGGLSFTDKTEVLFAYTDWLAGADISSSAFGLSQRIGEAGVIGISLNSFSFGEILVTSEDDPDNGTGATYKPQLLNLGVGFSRTFSNSIHGGITLRVINHSISNMRATGFAFDTGIQYVTGPRDNVKFGISLRNVGTPMKLSGDGLNYKSRTDIDTEITFSQRAEKYELPSLLNIGGAYDFNLTELFRLTAAVNFTSNSFSNDFFGAGLEVGFKEMFMVRAGFRYEDGLLDDLIETSALSGFSAGLTLEVPLGQDGPSFGFDYAYRTTDFFSGVHSLGIRIDL